MPLTQKMDIIAHVHSDFRDKFGIPRQSSLVPELESVLIFEPEYRNMDALRGLDQFSHIWLIWQFSESVREGWSPTVRPPRLGGNERLGVFATRSPFRPNEIGLSSVQLRYIEDTKNMGPVIHVAGADLMDGTPVFDIKPYLPYVDSHPEADGGFTENYREYHLQVDFPEELMERVPDSKRKALCGVLAGDPRPAYQQDPDGIYGMNFAGYEVKFRVMADVLTVLDVQTGER